MNKENDKLCLKWNDFPENAVSAFGTLREDREFADVTLACEDGQQVEAHKVILASSSPFFKNLLRDNKHTHPLIYMRGLKSEHLLAMVDFFYLGEANVYQEHLDAFLAVAEELQVKGLMGSGAENEATESYSNKPPPNTKTLRLSKERYSSDQEVSIIDPPSAVDKVAPSPPLEGAEAVTEYTEAPDYIVPAELVAAEKELDEKINSIVGYSGNRLGRGAYPNQMANICKVCGKEGPMGNIKSHIVSKHVPEVFLTCNICGFVAKTRKSYYAHRAMVHKVKN